MPTFRKPARRPRRLLRRLLFALLLVIGLPVAIFWAANRFDEPPNAAVIRYTSSPPRPVSDTDNAWLHFVGNGAPDSAQPVAYARARISATRDHSVATAQSTPASSGEGAAPSQKPWPDDPIVEVKPSLEIDGTEQLCPTRVVDCLEWAQRHRSMLERLRTANALRLQRVQAIFDLPDWQSLQPAEQDPQTPSVWIADLHSNLVALELADAASRPAEARLPALNELARVVEFWRRVLSQPQDLISTLTAARQIERVQRIGGAALEFSGAGTDPSVDAALDAAFDRIFAEPASPIDWQRAIRREFLYSSTSIKASLPGQWSALKRCVRGEATDGCVTEWAMNASFAPQATANLMADNYLRIERLLSTPPAQIEAATRHAGPEFESEFLDFENIPRLLRQMSYNFTGRVLAQIAIPAFDFHFRVNDQDALRRMWLAARVARNSSIPAHVMPDFLKQQSSSLRDPYSGEAFEWNDLFQEIRFKPRASRYWKRSYLHVPYPGSIHYAPIKCEKPLRLQFSEDSTNAAYPSLQLSSCGSGFLQIPTSAAGTNDDDGEKRAAYQRYYAVDVRQGNGRLGIRVIIDAGGKLQAHEAVAELGKGERMLALAPIDGEADSRIRVRLLGD